MKAEFPRRTPPNHGTEMLCRTKPGHRRERARSRRVLPLLRAVLTAAIACEVANVRAEWFEHVRQNKIPYCRQPSTGQRIATEIVLHHHLEETDCQSIENNPSRWSKAAEIHTTPLFGQVSSEMAAGHIFLGNLPQCGIGKLRRIGKLRCLVTLLLRFLAARGLGEGRVRVNVGGTPARIAHTLGSSLRSLERSASCCRRSSLRALAVASAADTAAAIPAAAWTAATLSLPLLRFNMARLEFFGGQTSKNVKPELIYRT